jgi:outer membrane scaffolding protein for murein synthesis (MipA/OmpV family)
MTLKLIATATALIVSSAQAKADYLCSGSPKNSTGAAKISLQVIHLGTPQIYQRNDTKSFVVFNTATDKLGLSGTVYVSASRAGVYYKYDLMDANSVEAKLTITEHGFFDNSLQTLPKTKCGRGACEEPPYETPVYFGHLTYKDTVYELQCKKTQT